MLDEEGSFGGRKRDVCGVEIAGKGTNFLGGGVAAWMATVGVRSWVRFSGALFNFQLVVWHNDHSSPRPKPRAPRCANNQ